MEKRRWSVALVQNETKSCSYVTNRPSKSSNKIGNPISVPKEPLTSRSAGQIIKIPVT